MPLPTFLDTQHSRRSVGGHAVVAGLVAGSLMAMLVVSAMSLHEARIDARHEQEMFAQDLKRARLIYGLPLTLSASTSVKNCGRDLVTICNEGVKGACEVTCVQSSVEFPAGHAQHFEDPTLKRWGTFGAL